MVIFGYNLYIFDWIQHDCLANTVFAVDSGNIVIKRLLLFMVIFLYDLYIFVWIQHGCLPSMVFAVDSGNSVIKRLWYISLSFHRKCCF